MKIEIILFAQLKEIFGKTNFFLEVPKGNSVGEVVEQLERESGKDVFGGVPLVFAVNEHFEMAEKKLADQDELAILTPVSGG